MRIERHTTIALRKSEDDQVRLYVAKYKTLYDGLLGVPRGHELRKGFKRLLATVYPYPENNTIPASMPLRAID